jgi:hypothetical protein
MQALIATRLIPSSATTRRHRTRSPRRQGRVGDDTRHWNVVTISHSHHTRERREVAGKNEGPSLGRSSDGLSCVYMTTRKVRADAGAVRLISVADN